VKLFHYIQEELVIPALEARNKTDVLHRMTLAFKKAGLIQDEEKLFRNVMAREKVLTTAIGGGLAVPHGFSEEIHDIAIAVATLRKGLNFQSLDKKPVKVIFMVVVNEKRTDLNLKALAAISRMAKHTLLLKRLKLATHADKILSIIRETEGRIAHH
jgi:fructose-specific phosphotransferase system IIA component